MKLSLEEFTHHFGSEPMSSHEQIDTSAAAELKCSFSHTGKKNMLFSIINNVTCDLCYSIQADHRQMDVLIRTLL